MSDGIKSEEVKFSNISLHEKTQKGLDENGYVFPTKIQQLSIENSMKGNDILGSAKTGSGKTLAFIIPILEILSKHNWNKLDGVGALVISPTRELAYQSFEVLKAVGKYHDFSAGLVIGGKDSKEEEKYIKNTNIIVCTPGRLLHHMDQTTFFDCLNLKLLVIDEADKIMDLDFSQTMNSIIDNLPSERQTMLFSATLNKSVKDLAQFSLKNPEILNVHSSSKYITPKNLTQLYTICELDEKLNFLYSFIKTHLKTKIIVFVSCCKEARYIYESFRTFRPGTSLISLYGSQKQSKRISIFNQFSSQQHCVLFATDLASRGLDFPNVDWVIQLDCPSDVDTYIHRVGRTARFNKTGKALLILLPSEEQFNIQLKDNKIPIEHIFFKSDRFINIIPKLHSFCAKETNNKAFAQQCLISYIKSIYLQKNKHLFDISKLNIENYANSLGLSSVPNLKFIKKGQIKELTSSSSINDKVSSNNICINGDDNANHNDDLLQPIETPTVIKNMPTKSYEEAFKPRKKIKVVTKAKLAKQLIKKGSTMNKKIKFDQDD